MTRSKKTLLACAAIAGLYAGASALSLHAADSGSSTPSSEKDKGSCSGKDGCKGKADSKASSDKGSCSGKDGCKGKADSKASGDKSSCNSKSSCKSKDSCKAGAETKKST